jgi:hypothetical protein
MCDDLFSDCSCDDDCCDGMTDCCDCCSSDAANTSATSGDASPSLDQGDNNCLHYLCCAGCFLCPLFYVGSKQQTLSSGEAALVESNPQPVETGKNDDTATVAASTTTTAETGTATLANDTDTVPMHSFEPSVVEAATPMQRN